MDMKQIENLLGTLALSITDAVAHNIEAVEDGYGLGTFALVLLQQGGPLRAGELGAKLRLSQSAIVHLVDRLERAGWVRRSATSTDRRVVLINLTAEGRRKAEGILAARQQVLGRLVGELSKPEQAALYALSKRLLQALTAGAVHDEHHCRLCDKRACSAECPVDQLPAASTPAPSLPPAPPRPGVLVAF